MTFYLKYRPQTIGELDLASVRKELGNILASGSFSHAYLFAGPRGTGKTSAARILAKVVNCRKNKKQAISSKKQAVLEEPCNECDACREITAGTALDLIEIDAASNRGIDDIRELRERIKLAPVNSAYKVYIIDEVHMLTMEAFNALLKTLEEPPQHALFILCTTEMGRVPETIVSRCTLIRFGRASREELVASLKKVTDKEKLKFERGVLEMIAETSDGSFRDGMKILEQLSLRVADRKKDKEIKRADVLEVSGLKGEQAARQFIINLTKFERAGLFKQLEQIASEGVSFEQFTREILEMLRTLLLIELDVAEGDSIENLGIQQIKELISLFTKAAYSIKQAPVPSLPIEMAVAEWLEQEDHKFKEKNIEAGTEKVNSENKDEESIKTVKSGMKEAKNTGKEGIVNIRKTIKVTFSQIEKSWPGVLQCLRPKNHSLEALLKASRPVKLEDEEIVVEVYYKFHKEQLELVRYKAMVEAAVREVIAEGLRLKYILGKRREGVEKADQIEENISGKVEDEEIVKAAEEIFGAD